MNPIVRSPIALTCIFVLLSVFVGKSAENRDDVSKRLKGVILPKIELQEASFESALHEVETVANQQLSPENQIKFASSVPTEQLKNTKITASDTAVPLLTLMLRLERFFGVRFEISGNIIEAVADATPERKGRRVKTEKPPQNEEAPARLGGTRAFVDYLNARWADADHTKLKEAIDLRLKETGGKDLPALLALADYEMGFEKKPDEARKVARRIETFAKAIQWQNPRGYEKYRPLIEAYMHPEKLKAGQWTFDWEEMRKQDDALFPNQGLLRQAGKDQYGGEE